MSFQTALSGLNAASAHLNVTGHNIANASTNGFKHSRPDFADVYAVSFGGVSKTNTGSGVRVAAVTQQFTQGNVDFTDNNLDIAISGEGFFILNDNGSQMFTRAGNFAVDRDGYVVNVHGQRVQQYEVNPDTGLVTNFTPTDMKLNLGAIEASQTERLDINLNLDAGAEPIDHTINALDFDPNDSETYQFSTTTTIYDSLGVTHQVSLYFRKDTSLNPNEWTVHMEITDNDGSSGYSSTLSPLSFDTSGNLMTLGDQDFMAGGPWTPSTGAADFDELFINFLGSTQFGANSSVNTFNQDGYTTGRLSGISVDGNGVLFARYTNGQSSTVGAFAIARFNNPNGLQQVGDTNWAQTFESGDLLLGQAGTGTFGQMQSGALEASNVDLSKQLVNMIIAQRDFQANAKMISTEDQITQTIINIR